MIMRVEGGNEKHACFICSCRPSLMSPLVNVKWVGRFSSNNWFPIASLLYSIDQEKNQNTMIVQEVETDLFHRLLTLRLFFGAQYGPTSNPKKNHHPLHVLCTRHASIEASTSIVANVKCKLLLSHTDPFSSIIATVCGHQHERANLSVYVLFSLF